MQLIADQLIQAYRKAVYRVQPGRIDACNCAGFDLQVDHASSELAALLACTHEGCATLITADNPASQPCSDPHNREQGLRLRAAISALGRSCIETRALDPENHWPPEHGLLVPGLALEPAKRLGIDFGQNAILWANTDACPRLILLQ